jgi:hypothetical protein
MRVRVEDAARILGASPLFVRTAMQQGLLPIGTAVKMSSVWTYNIQLELLSRYLGREIKKDELKGG